MNTLNNYLDKNGYKILMDKEVTNIYRENKGSFEKICGPIIFDTLDGFMDDDDDDNNIIKLIIINKYGNPVSIFYGTIENDYITSDYTCSSELPKGGAILRFYALLLANQKNPNINKLIGSISGGIPALLSDDSEESINKKRDKLTNYHMKNGAHIEGKIFTYELHNVQEKINEMFGTSGGKRIRYKKQKRKTVKLQKRGHKRRKLYTRKRY